MSARRALAHMRLSPPILAVLLFAFGIIVSALPILSSHYVLTQDGASHYNLAADAAGLESTASSFFSRYFVFRPFHLSNQLVARFMIWTDAFGHGERAERVAWMVIFTAFSAVVAGNLWILRRDAVVFSLMFFPIFSGQLINYGFMNYVIGVVLFIQSAFLLQYGLSRPSTRWMIAFIAVAAATYAAHPIAGLILAATIGPFGIAYIVSWKMVPWGRSSESFSILIPAGCMLACGVVGALAVYDALPQIVDFLAIAGRGASGAPAAIALAAQDSWRQRLIDVVGLSYFVSYSPGDYLFSLLFGFVVGWLILRRLLEFRRKPGWRQEDNWLASVASLLILSLVVPRHVEYFLPERLSASLLSILLLWLASDRLGRRVFTTFAIVGLLLNTGFCAWRLQWTASIDGILDEYASVAPFIPENTSVIVMTTSPSYLQSNCQAVRARALPCRFRPTLNFMGGVLAGRPVAFLSNYQLRTESGFFPVSLRAPWDQYARYILDFQRWPPTPDARGQAVLAGAASLIESNPPDIIVTWDERIATGAATGLFPAAAELLSQNYTRVFTTLPLGAASVYVKHQP